MKRFLPILLVWMLIFVGCYRLMPRPAPEATVPTTEASSVPETTAPETEPTVPPATEATIPPTTEPAPTGYLSFNTYDITFRVYGDSWGVYNGTVPNQYVTFSSENEKVVTFVDGVVTATGPGTALVHADFNGERISCIIRCVFEMPDFTRFPVLEPPEVSDGPCRYFDDAVFVGDSVSLKLSYYAIETGLLGDAQFLVRGSYSVGHALNGTMLMPWQGEEMELDDAIAATGAKKVFFMLGMNDIDLYGIKSTIANWDTLIARIREKVPDMEVFIQSMTPVWTGGEKGGLNNTNVDKYNEKLAEFAEKRGFTFVDIAPYMKDSTNGLASAYCSDKYVHLTSAGADAWIKVLKAFAGS